MRRRDFIAGLGAAASPALWPRVALGQAVDRRRRVGVLMNYAPAQAEAQAYLAAFIQRLRQLGWIEGHNVRIDVRWNGGDVDLARTDAAELIDLMPDAILATEVTSAVPVVFVSGSDPGAPSFVASVKQQPGGAVTRFGSYDQSIAGKWLDLLKGLVTGLTRVAVMFNPDTAPQAQFFLQAVEAAAPSVGVATVAAPVRVSADIEATLATFARASGGGLILPDDSFTRLHSRLIAELAGRYRLPSIAAAAGFAKSGGLMDFGSIVDVVGQYRQAAGYVDRILNGWKAGDLPVQGADRYRFVINLGTAAALGLTVPLPLLGLADEVIDCDGAMSSWASARRRQRDRWRQVSSDRQCRSRASPTRQPRR